MADFNDSSEAEKRDTLIFAHVIFRHGDRTILGPYPNDPYKDEAYWPEGFGQLTKEGKQQLHRLGQYLRRRYNQLVGPSYSPKTTFIQSTDIDRTIMSAQVCLAGMFPPTLAKEKWHDDINWQPIPIHTLPLSMDNVLIACKKCPSYDVLYKNYIDNSPEIQMVYNEWGNLFSQWSSKTGSSVKTIDDVIHLHNVLTIEKKRFNCLPDWAEEAILPDGKMEYIAKLHINSYAATPELARLKSGFLIKEIMERFKKKIEATLSPDRSLWLYSAHDYTIANMLNAFGVYKRHLPPYGASLHLELFRTYNGDHYFQICYRKSEEEHPQPLHIPGCGETCSLEKFEEVFRQIIPGDFDEECRIVP